MTRKHKKMKKTNRGEPGNFPGQHLLHNRKIIAEMVERAKIHKNDIVIDLGAGKGAITSALSKRAGKVLAVEYDRKFVQILKEKFLHSRNTKVIHEDILKLRLPKEPFVVVSNIPYSITTPIMKMLLNQTISSFQRGVILVEKGAAKRFTANFVKDPYIIAWRMWFDIRYVKVISRVNFSPPPRVDSAMMMITRKAEPIVPYRDSPLFWRLVCYVLKNPHAPIDFALRGVFTPPQIKQLKRNLGIKDEMVAGGLSAQQWGLIFETMVRHVPKFRWPK